MVSKREVNKALIRIAKSTNVLLLDVEPEKRIPWQLRQLKMVKK